MIFFKPGGAKNRYARPGEVQVPETVNELLEHPIGKFKFKPPALGAIKIYRLL